MRFVSSKSLPASLASGSNSLTVGDDEERHHQRRATHPFRMTGRRKPRRWPLVFRFIKGAIHATILFQVVSHSIFTALVVCLDKYVYDRLGLPPTIIPSLSIVVGLILVFRNQTSYNRFWDGRVAFSTIHSANRNLIRGILTNSSYKDRLLSAEEKHDVERTIRILMAFPYAVKNYLRAEWSTVTGDPGSVIAETAQGAGSLDPEYRSLLPAGFESHESEGLGVPLQLTFLVETFIQRGVARGWYDPPGASQMGNQLNTITDAYGKMETIKLTPIPIAHLIHQKQVLALFGCVLPFAMVDDLGWWAIPIVSVVIFTLYGIEGIGSQLEDPFGYDRNDIKMDAIVQDEKVEIEAVLNDWRRSLRAEEWRVGAATDNGETATNGKNGSTNGHTNGKTPSSHVLERKDLFIR